MVLVWFPMTSSWNPTWYIRGLIHGIGRGVPNGFRPEFTESYEECRSRCDKLKHGTNRQILDCISVCLADQQIPISIHVSTCDSIMLVRCRPCKLLKVREIDLYSWFQKWASSRENPVFGGLRPGKTKSACAATTAKLCLISVRTF